MPIGIHLTCSIKYPTCYGVMFLTRIQTAYTGEMPFLQFIEYLLCIKHPKEIEHTFISGSSYLRICACICLYPFLGKCAPPLYHNNPAD